MRSQLLSLSQEDENGVPVEHCDGCGMEMEGRDGLMDKW